MGYHTISYTTIRPSYYRLSDGTIISALTIPNYFLGDTTERLSGGSVNVANSYVPQRLRMPEKYDPNQPHTPNQIIERDMDFKALKEDYSVYTLNNGIKVSIRTVVSQIDKTDLVSPLGEPIYNIQIQPVIKVKQK